MRVWGRIYVALIWAVFSLDHFSGAFSQLQQITHALKSSKIDDLKRREAMTSDMTGDLASWGLTGLRLSKWPDSRMVLRHPDPPMLAIPNFLTPDECDEIIELAKEQQRQGKEATDYVRKASIKFGFEYLNILNFSHQPNLSLYVL